MYTHFRPTSSLVNDDEKCSVLKMFSLKRSIKTNTGARKVPLNHFYFFLVVVEPFLKA